MRKHFFYPLTAPQKHHFMRWKIGVTALQIAVPTFWSCNDNPEDIYIFVLRSVDSSFVHSVEKEKTKLKCLSNNLHQRI